MSEEQLRARLAERLGQTSVSDMHWQLLEREGHVEDARKVGEAGIEDLVEAARALGPYVELMEGVAPSPGRGEGRREGRSREYRMPEVDAKEARYVLERAATLGEYLSLRASLHPDVRRFRDRILEGRFLTPQEAHAFIESPANSRFSPEFFEEAGVPLVGHTARFLDHGVVEEGDNGGFVEFEVIYIDPPGDVFVARLPVSVFYDDLIKARFPAKTRNPISAGPYSGAYPTDERVYIPVYPDSVLDYLGWLSLRVSEHFCHAWDETQAAWFLLTGEDIAPRAMAGHYDSADGEDLTYGTITLKIEPWIPANTVAAFYQHLQRDVLRQTPRAPSLRNLAVFRFVTGELKRLLVDASETEDIEWSPQWPEFMRRWNDLHRSEPSWTYRHLSKFKRDYYRGGRAVAEPYDHRELILPYA